MFRVGTTCVGNILVTRWPMGRRGRAPRWGAGVGVVGAGEAAILGSWTPDAVAAAAAAARYGAPPPPPRVPADGGVPGAGVGGGGDAAAGAGVPAVSMGLAAELAPPPPLPAAGILGAEVLGVGGGGLAGQLAAATLGPGLQGMDVDLPPPPPPPPAVAVAAALSAAAAVVQAPAEGTGGFAHACQVFSRGGPSCDALGSRRTAAE